MLVLKQQGRRSMVFSHQDHSTDAIEVIRRHFTPEFRNRLDAIVQFSPLSMEVIKSVVDKFIFELQSQLDERKITIEIDEEARTWLAENGYDKAMGARPMARLIQDKIKKPLADQILFGDLSDNGGSVCITVENGDLAIHCDLEMVQ